MKHKIQRKYAIPIAGLVLISVAIAFTFLSSFQMRVFDNQVIKSGIEKNMEIEYVRAAQFQLISAELDHALDGAGILGRIQIAKIEKEILALDNLAFHLETFNNDGNKIAKILDKYTRGIFYGKPSDANDPFIMIVNINKEAIIATDTSENCAVFNEDGTPQRTRTLDEEYPMHANVLLAETAFPRIVMNDAWTLKTPIFFQFLGDTPLLLESFDLEGLRTNFLLNEGRWDITFKNLEFLVPTYLHGDKDVLGVQRVTNRGYLNDDIKIIIYVVAFKFFDYIEEDPRIIEYLAKYDFRVTEIENYHIAEVELLEANIITYKLASVLLNFIIGLAMLSLYVILKE